MQITSTKSRDSHAGLSGFYPVLKGYALLVFLKKKKGKNPLVAVEELFASTTKFAHGHLFLDFVSGVHAPLKTQVVIPSVYKVLEVVGTSILCPHVLPTYFEENALEESSPPTRVFLVPIYFIVACRSKSVFFFKKT